MLNPGNYADVMQEERAKLRTAESLDELQAVLGRITQLQEAQLAATGSPR
ncbi:MAG: hypothetical protein PVI23_14295 [Maricaulaceae bacterium]|jgi:hypothetical protein